jgi:diguanylate cyclase (GGDEF)-like protein
MARITEGGLEEAEASRAGHVALSVIRQPAFLCRPTGEVLAVGTMGRTLLPEQGAGVHVTMPTLDLERFGERQVVRVLDARRRCGVSTHVRVEAIGPLRLVVLDAVPSPGSSHELVQRLQAITSERRMTLEQRLDALFRVGADHFGLPRVVQSRIEGRFRLVERCVDPTGAVTVGDDHELSTTWCDETRRSAHPTAVADVAVSDLADAACNRRFPIGAYLGAPIIVDAVKYGTLSFSADQARLPFSDDELLAMRLLATLVGHELARDRDLRLYQRAQDDLDRLARTDALTRLPNRRAVTEALHWQVAYVRRSGMPLSVVLADLDHFKAVNDRYGHDGGDAVLRHFADICRAQKRETDVCGRWGGEEFLFLLPNTDAAGARVFCERLAEALRSGRIGLPGGVEIAATVSMGAATVWSTETDESAVGRADAALYQAKAAGRDRVVVDESATPVPLPDRADRRGSR